MRRYLSRALGASSCRGTPRNALCNPGYRFLRFSSHISRPQQLIFFIYSLFLLLFIHCLLCCRFLFFVLPSYCFFRVAFFATPSPVLSIIFRPGIHPSSHGVIRITHPIASSKDHQHQFPTLLCIAPGITICSPQQSLPANMTRHLVVVVLLSHSLLLNITAQLLQLYLRLHCHAPHNRLILGSSRCIDTFCVPSFAMTCVLSGLRCIHSLPFFNAFAMLLHIHIASTAT